MGTSTDALITNCAYCGQPRDRDGVYKVGPEEADAWVHKRCEEEFQVRNYARAFGVSREEALKEVRSWANG